MKKILLSALALAMALLLLTACNTKQPESETPEPVIESSEPSPEPETEPTHEPEDEIGGEGAEPDVQDTEDSSGYKKGSTTDTTFESEYLDLRFTLPEGFVMATDEDLQMMMGLATELTELDADLVEYANITTVYEMMASDITSGTNVIVFVEKLSFSNLTAEQYLTALKAQLEMLTNPVYELDDEISSVEIAGQSYQQMSASTIMYGMVMTQTYTVRKIDGRMVGFIITNTSAEGEMDIADALMAGFTKY